MHRALVTLCLFALLLCVSVDGQGGGGSSGSGTASSTSGTEGSGGSFTTITTTVTTRSGNRTTTTTNNSSTSDEDADSSSSGRGGRSARQVNVDDGEAEATSEVSGEGNISASASASSSPSGSRGRSSTTVNGETETLEKEKKEGEETKTKRSSSTSEDDEKSGSRGRFTSSRDASSDELPVCMGLAKFDCCDDRNFKTFNGQSYCGCWGTGQSKDRCNFERTSTNPIVVRDIFANLIGYSCQCPDNDEEEEVKSVKVHFEEEIGECTGYTQYMCCDHHDGSDRCRCYTDTECLYDRISSNPTVWAHKWAKYKKCKCS